MLNSFYARNIYKPYQMSIIPPDIIATQFTRIDIIVT
jgi:hypothetical protein